MKSDTDDFVRVETSKNQSVSVDEADRGPLVWGLDAARLHDAWWRGQGVQCVKWGTEFVPLSGAELFLLLDPGQLVSFDLSDLSETIVWSLKRALWVGVMERSDESYREALVLNAEEEVVGIRRSYAFDERLGHRCVLTPHRKLAESWGRAFDRRDARKSIRRFAGADVSRDRVVGHCRNASLPEDRRRFISWLVAIWENPARVIKGIQEVKPRVFAPEGVEISEDLICIEPVWLGDRRPLPPATILIGPDFAEDDGSTIRGNEESVLPIMDIPIPGGRRSGRLLPRKSLYQMFKRGFDFALAATVLLVFSPLLLLVALAVAIDDGFPVFFGHTRQKKSGDNFKCWKFRTMRRNAESMVADLQALNQADGPQVLIANDPRVTRIGRILRKLQLDELPQFWNVLLGDMSIVGPRPSPDGENQFCPAWREIRLSVRPGITGLWQVERTRAPGQDFQEWIKYDIEYVRTASFALDLRIIIKTAWNIVNP